MGRERRKGDKEERGNRKDLIESTEEQMKGEKAENTENQNGKTTPLQNMRRRIINLCVF